MHLSWGVLESAHIMPPTTDSRRSFSLISICEAAILMEFYDANFGVRWCDLTGRVG